MFRSFLVGRLAGIAVYLHMTFLLLLGWIGLGSLASGSMAPFVVAVMLFTIVVLHELGHALAARRYGIATRDITLYPMGGVARLERLPANAHQEVVVAAAGPAVNFALAAGALALAPLVDSPLLATFVSFNVGLGLFNLLPAFPMDGGRILRALLSRRRGFYEATRISATLGRGLAWALGLFGLLSGSFNLVLIGLFVWFAATAELGQAMMMARRWR